LLAFAVAALIPNPPTPPVLTWDKAQHALVFLVLAFWCAQVWDRAPRRWLVTALLAYGFGIECLQGLTATRMFELMDFAADALGVVPGVWLAGACHGKVVDAMDAFLSRS
jgi:VanZ family protein